MINICPYKGTFCSIIANGGDCDGCVAFELDGENKALDEWDRQRESDWDIYESIKEGE